MIRNAICLDGFSRAAPVRSLIRPKPRFRNYCNLFEKKWKERAAKNLFREKSRDPLLGGRYAGAIMRICTKCAAIVIVLLPVFPGRAATTAEPQTRPAGAAGAVRAYVDLLKSGKPAQAIGTYFDVDALFAASFGADMAKVTPQQKRIMATQMKESLVQLLGNRQIADAMARGTFGGFDENPVGQGKVFVTVTFTFQKLRSISNYLVKKTSAGWRIIDIQMNKQPSIATAVRQDYQDQKKHFPDLLPPEFVQSFSDQIRQVATRPATRPAR